MTRQHAIVAFPAFDPPHTVEAVRRDFDPQASLLAAHITLVFPFVAPLDSSFLREHIASCVAGVSRFDVELAPPSAEENEYLFLRVTSGRDRIIGLHDRLYSGPLADHLSRSHAYEPHVTIGRLRSADALATAVAAARARIATPLSARIDGVALFCLDEGTGRIEHTIPLGDGPPSPIG